MKARGKWQFLQVLFSCTSETWQALVVLSSSTYSHWGIKRADSIGSGEACRRNRRLGIWSLGSTGADPTGLLSTHMKVAHSYGCSAVRACTPSVLFNQAGDLPLDSWAEEMRSIYLQRLPHPCFYFCRTLSQVGKTLLIQRLTVQLKKTFHQGGPGLIMKLKPNAHSWHKTKCMNVTGSFLSV